jgi:hypothetical protein
MAISGSVVIEGVDRKKSFDPFRLISNDEYSKNLNAIIAYYQISKGETKKRFVSSEPPLGEELIAS